MAYQAEQDLIKKEIATLWMSSHRIMRMFSSLASVVISNFSSRTVSCKILRTDSAAVKQNNFCSNCQKTSFVTDVVVIIYL